MAESEGQIVGMSVMRLMFQIEPLWLFPEFKESAPKNAQRRAAYGLAKAVEGWLQSSENKTGLRSYFAYIIDPLFQKLAMKWGCLEIYRKGKFFGRDL